MKLIMKFVKSFVIWVRGDMSGNKNSKLVSVIMSFYNSEASLEKSIRSVFLQTYSNIELIVVDNCSNDQSKNIVFQLKEEFCNLIYIKTEMNSGGPAIPRNAGINIAQGEYIAFIDSDDIWKNTKVTNQIEYMLDYNLVCSNVTVNDVDKFLKTDKSSHGKIIKYSELILRNYITHSSVMVNAKLFKKILFETDSALIGFEDYYAYLKYIFFYGPGYRIGDSLVEYRKSSDSLGEKTDVSERFVKSLYTILKLTIDIGDFRSIFLPILYRISIFLKIKFIRIFFK